MTTEIEAGTPLRELQARQSEWAARQGWERGDGTLAFIGMGEELGEMADAIGWTKGIDPDVVRAIYMIYWTGKFCHATLKRLQGIRTNEDHARNAQTARQALHHLASAYDATAESEGVLLGEAEAGAEPDLERLADGLGDLHIYGFDVATRKGIDVQETLERTCAQVFDRDWVANPTDGKA